MNNISGGFFNWTEVDDLYGPFLKKQKSTNPTYTPIHHQWNNKLPCNLKFRNSSHGLMDRFLPIRACDKLIIRISALRQPRPPQSFHPLSVQVLPCADVLALSGTSRACWSKLKRDVPVGSKRDFSGRSDRCTGTLQNDLPKRSLQMDRLIDTSSRFRAWWREKKHTILSRSIFEGASCIKKTRHTSDLVRVARHAYC
jgi:hypothetical protein